MGGVFSSPSRPAPPEPPPMAPAPAPAQTAAQTSSEEYLARKRAQSARSALGEPGGSASGQLTSSLGGS